MRKSLKHKESAFILSNNYIGHLGYIYNNKPYVIPITYFYNGEKIICYSGDGHKINALRLHSAVALEVTEIESVNDWTSVVAHGTFEEMEGSHAKALLHEFSLGIKDLVLRKELVDLDYIHEFSAKIETDNLPIVFIIHIDEITGRLRHQ
ncbi:MAG: flavin mononucleotide-binding protein [Flavobacteriaceae bacterium]|nr:flavin mononucleotide-binding protein [Flavobacteriaceae bacterium]|tara:strand:+ start:402 stop:851 length:450 start_codon:yes stop_codon:yes gene_type:complete